MSVLQLLADSTPTLFDYMHAMADMNEIRDLGVVALLPVIHHGAQHAIRLLKHHNSQLPSVSQLPTAQSIPEQQVRQLYDEEITNVNGTHV